MAAALLLAAFTVYFVMSFVTRDDPLGGRAAGAREAEHLMSAADATPRRQRASPPAARATAGAARGGMSTKTKLLDRSAACGSAGVIVLIAIYGFHGTRNKEFEPQNEFKLDNWVDTSGIFSINKAVLYLFLAAVADLRHDDLHRAAHAAAPEQGAGRGRGALQADARQHHRQRDGREDGRASGSRSSARCSCSSSSPT